MPELEENPAVTCAIPETRTYEPPAGFEPVQPPRQHVSDAAWERMLQETENFLPTEQPRKDFEMCYAEAGLMLVTVDEWESNASGHRDAAWIAQQADDIMNNLRKDCHTAIERMKDAEGKLLDANIRIEWLERQLAKCKGGDANNDRGRTEGRDDQRRSETPHGPADALTRAAHAKNAGMLITPNLTDPRFGR